MEKLDPQRLYDAAFLFHKWVATFNPCLGDKNINNMANESASKEVFLYIISGRFLRGSLEMVLNLPGPTELPPLKHKVGLRLCN